MVGGSHPGPVRPARFTCALMVITCVKGHPLSRTGVLLEYEEIGGFWASLVTVNGAAGGRGTGTEPGPDETGRRRAVPARERGEPLTHELRP